jgi:predicted Zn-dependent protease
LLNSNRIEQGLPLLAQQLSTVLAGQSPAAEQGFDRQFQNDLLVTALSFLATDELDSARLFIESALVREPDHVFALYLLAGIHLQQTQAKKAVTVTERALSLIGMKSSPYRARLLLLQGAARLQLGDLADAAPLLAEAAAHTYRDQDWLYYAYSQAMAGNSALLQRDYAKAYPLLTTAMQYQQLLACPQGIIQSQLDLASYFLLTDQLQQAEQYLQQSKRLASQQGLVKLLPDIAQLEHALQQRL